MEFLRGFINAVLIEAALGGLALGLWLSSGNPTLLMAGAMLAACGFFYCIGRALLPKGVKVRITKPRRMTLTPMPLAREVMPPDSPWRPDLTRKVTLPPFVDPNAAISLNAFQEHAPLKPSSGLRLVGGDDLTYAYKFSKRIH